MRVTLGYPDAAHERELLRSGDRRDLIPHLEAVLGPEAVLQAQHLVRATHVAEPLLDYVQAVIARTREQPDLKLGLSPRAGQGLIRAAQAWARLAGRAAVLPEDVQAVLPAVIAHRLERREAYRQEVTGSAAAMDVATELIRTVPVRV
jgi:MoxR-like ATPase